MSSRKCQQPKIRLFFLFSLSVGCQWRRDTNNNLTDQRTVRFAQHATCLRKTSDGGTGKNALRLVTRAVIARKSSTRWGKPGRDRYAVTSGNVAGAFVHMKKTSKAATFPRTGPKRAKRPNTQLHIALSGTYQCKEIGVTVLQAGPVSLQVRVRHGISIFS